MAEDDERRFLTAIGIGFGQAEAAFALCPFLAIGYLVDGRTADVAEMIVDDLEKDKIALACSEHGLAAAVMRNDFHSVVHTD